MTARAVRKKVFVERRRSWRFSDLWTDHVTGRMRESAIASIWFKVLVGYEYAKHVGPDNFESMTAVAAAVVIGHDIANRGLNIKSQKDIPQQIPTQPGDSK